METGVDVNIIARDTGSVVGEQEGCRIADFVDRDRASERSGGLHVFQNLGEILDAAGSQRLDRPEEIALARMPLGPKLLASSGQRPQELL